MKKDFHLLMKTQYVTCKGYEYNVDRFPIADNYGRPIDFLQLFITNEKAKNELVFNHLGLVGSQNRLRQNILTGILNVNSPEDLLSLIQIFGSPVAVDPEKNKQFLFRIPELMSIVNTLKSIILIKKELSSPSPEIDTLFTNYKKLISDGNYLIHTYDYGEPFPLEEQRVSLLTYWGRTLLYPNRSYLDIHNNVEDYLYRNGLSFGASSSFTDTILEKDCKGSVEELFPGESGKTLLSKKPPFSRVLQYFYDTLPYCFSIDYCEGDDHHKHDLNIICLYHYLADLKGNPDDLTEDSISANDFDDLSITKLKSFANSLCDDYLGRISSPMELKYYDGFPTIMIKDLINATVLSLSCMDFDKYTFDRCDKLSCKKYFIRSSGRVSSRYCCEAHARSEAQMAHRLSIKEKSKKRK